VTLTRGKDCLHIEVQIGKRHEVELEELPRPSCPTNGAGNVSDSHVVFVSNRFTKASTSCAFHAAKLSLAM
jgi:hypothetical protein